MAKIEKHNQRSIGSLLGTTLLACWALYTTVLSHDRIFYGVATFAAQQSQRVAAKYAPPVVTKYVRVETKQPVAQAMPPKKSIWEVSKADIPDLPHAGWATIERAR
jgi:hypothetical protein